MLVLTFTSFVLLSGCGPSPEPLVLPDDPAERGVPVGVRTVNIGGDLTVEIWYPASDEDAAAAAEAVDFNEYVPQVFYDAVGDFSFPAVNGLAARDLALRVPETPYPVVFFSHGLGGARVQSINYTTHLASRGYVVLSADHVGRRMTDLLPCLLSPPLEGCDLSGTIEDPGPEDVADALDWLTDQSTNEESWLYGAVDLSRVGLSGHSAGGGTTASLGDEDARFTSLLTLAAGGAVERDVPTMVMGGECDSFAGEASVGGAYDANERGAWVSIAGAGHLAFSDLCDLKLDELGDALLADRDDLNDTLYDLLVQLATDGCPTGAPPPTCSVSAYGDLPAAQEAVRRYSTEWFDLTLRGEARDLGAAPSDGVTVESKGL
ncbi:MAG: hypothetical protein IPI35_25355 [Deltaproteobacteria bacterium]|nr:hypothetical protein [Deltaproteobacteria bacterium]